MIRQIGFSALLGFSLLSSPSSASESKRGRLFTSMTGDDTAAILEREGHTLTQRVAASGGNGPVHIFRVNGVKTGMYHFNCDSEGECRSVQLYVGLSMEEKPTVEMINEWNKGHRLTRAYIDNVGDPCLEADLQLSGGVSKQAIVELLEMFTYSTSKFLEHVGFTH